MNPCGIGQADDIETAWDYAYESDPVSIFGGIVVLNREVDTRQLKKCTVSSLVSRCAKAEALEILTPRRSFADS